jgi:hypothetical protein
MYIDKMPDRQPLRIIIDEYCEKIQNFYKWYQQRFKEIFKNEFLEANRLQDEYNNLVELTENHRKDGQLKMNQEIGRLQRKKK